MNYVNKFSSKMLLEAQNKSAYFKFMINTGSDKNGLSSFETQLCLNFVYLLAQWIWHKDIKIPNTISEQLSCKLPKEFQ